jgi:hypothetical protein
VPESVVVPVGINPDGVVTPETLDSVEEPDEEDADEVERVANGGREP